MEVTGFHRSPSPLDTISYRPLTFSNMVSSGLMLALAGLAAAAERSGYSVMRNPNADGLGAGFDGLNLALGGSCDVGEKVCDSRYCIPILGQCCAVGNGAYCKSGKYCVTGGCCQTGKICRGGSGGCDVGEVSCGNFCMDAGGDCCNTATGQWCDAGKKCVNGGTQCAIGGGSGGGASSSNIFGGGRSTSVGGGGASSSDIFGGGASTSYSLAPAATTDSGFGGSSPTTASDSSGSTPTGDSGDSGSSSTSTSTSSTSSSSASASAAATTNRPPSAGAVNAPNLLIGGLLAAAPLLL